MEKIKGYISGKETIYSERALKEIVNFIFN